MFQQRSLKSIGLLSLMMLLLVGCSERLIVDREAMPATLNDPAWREHWKGSTRVEETRSVVGREVTVRALSHAGMWTFSGKAAIAVASTPQLAILGMDANPVATLTDEELVQFIVDTALAQAIAIPGLQIPKNPTLQKEQDESIQTSIGSLTGSRFKVTSDGVTGTVVVLRVKSGSDHVVILGLIPGTLDPAIFNLFINALKGITHPT